MHLYIQNTLILVSTTEVQRSFFPGDKWLYLKIYVGKFSANGIITQVFYPIGKKLIKEGKCTKWFFIRYHDPNHHLRFRLELTDVSYLMEVLLDIIESINGYIKSNIIWKIQIDTYNREIERYGKERMIMSEELFYENSMIVSQILLKVSDEKQHLIYAITIILDLLEKLDGFDGKTFLSYNTSQYKKEFKVNAKTQKHLKLKYKEIQDELEKFRLDIGASEIIRLNIPFRDKVTNYYKAEKKRESFNLFLSSHIHMFVNRLFSERQREFELVVYEFSYRQVNKTISPMKKNM